MGVPDERKGEDSGGRGAQQGAAGSHVSPDCSKLGEARLHPLGFTLVGFLISMLWFTINKMPIVPVGYVIALLMAFWLKDLEDAILGRNYLLMRAVIYSVGTIIGLLLLLM